MGGTVDAVWDRDALSAVNVDDRFRYVRQLSRLLKDGGNMLLDTPLYDEKEYLGDPHPVTDDDLHRLFGGGEAGGVGGDCEGIGGDDSGCYTEEDDAGRGDSSYKGKNGGCGNTREADGTEICAFESELLEVVDGLEVDTWPREYGLSHYVKRIHLLTKKGK